MVEITHTHTHIHRWKKRSRSPNGCGLRKRWEHATVQPCSISIAVAHMAFGVQWGTPCFLVDMSIHVNDAPEGSTNIHTCIRFSTAHMIHVIALAQAVADAFRAPAATGLGCPHWPLGGLDQKPLELPRSPNRTPDLNQTTWPETDPFLRGLGPLVFLVSSGWKGVGLCACWGSIMTTSPV